MCSETFALVQYIALSYTWGDDVPDKDKRSISLGERLIRIRPNLFDILQRISNLDRRLHNLPTGNLLIWVSNCLWPVFDRECGPSCLLERYNRVPNRTLTIYNR
jgi:hypothetical protein